MDKNYSVLNSVLASSADYDATGLNGNVLITGLPAFPKSCVTNRVRTTASLYKSATTGTTSGFYVIDSAAVLSSGTFTWSGAVRTTILGEVLEVTGGGLTYYAAVTSATTASATQAITVWFGDAAPDGTYTVTRKGAAFTKVTLAALTPSAVSISSLYQTDMTGGILNEALFTYGTASAPVTITQTDLTLLYYAWCQSILEPLGFKAATNSTSIVYIMQPAETLISTASLAGTVSGYTQSTVVMYLPVTRYGYGADLIKKYGQGYATATSQAANDGIYSTNWYTVDELFVSVPSNTGTVNSYSLVLLVNVLDTPTGNAANATDLLSTIASAFPA